MPVSIVRVVVNGCTYASDDREEFYNVSEAQQILSDATRPQIWPKPTQRATITVTPGGFVKVPFDRPPEKVIKGGWGSEKYFRDVLPAAERAVQQVLTPKSLIKRLQARTRLLTIGVDVRFFDYRNDTHAELVAVVSTQSAKVIRWTGKSYPVSQQQNKLIYAPLESHFLQFAAHSMLILGCHDLNMYSQRAKKSLRKNSPKHKQHVRIKKLTQEFRPKVILHHPHHTDSPRIWSTAWAGVRKNIPTAEICASGIAYYNPEDGPRAPLEKVLSGTAYGNEIVDIEVDGPYW